MGLGIGRSQLCYGRAECEKPVEPVWEAAEGAAGDTSLAFRREDTGIIRVQTVFVLMDSFKTIISKVCLCPF